MTVKMPAPLRRHRRVDVSSRGPKDGVGEYHFVTLPAEPWAKRGPDGELTLEEDAKPLNSLVGVARFELTTPASRRQSRSVEPSEVRQLFGKTPIKPSLLPTDAGAKRGRGS